MRAIADLAIECARRMIFADNGAAAVIVILNDPDEAVILKNRYGPIGRMPMATIAAFFSTVETNYPESRPVLYEIVPEEFPATPSSREDER